jgi:hypothetical protein
MNIKNKITLGSLGLIIICSCSYGQTSYQNYDSVTRGAEYHITTSQARSNQKQIELLKLTKNSYSTIDNSKIRSRIQAVISAKEDENFRLRQKSYLIMNSTKIDDVDGYNRSVSRLRSNLANGK